MRIGGRLPFGTRVHPLAVFPILGVPEAGNPWVELTAPPSPFENGLPPAVALANGGLVLVGAGDGSDKVWTYDPSTNAYTSTTDAATTTERGGELVGTETYLISTAFTSGAYRWVAGTWTTRAAATGLGAGTQLTTCTAGGLVYAFSAGFFASYDPSSNTWTNLSYPTASDVGGDDPMVASGGNIYLFSGLHTSKYVIATDTWDAGVTLAARPTKVYGSAIGLISGRVYLAGGYLLPGFAVQTRLDIYDIGGDSWSEGPPMSSASSFLGGCVIGGRFYVFGTDGASAPFARVYTP